MTDTFKSFILDFMKQEFPIRKKRKGRRFVKIIWIGESYCITANTYISYEIRKDFMPLYAKLITIMCDVFGLPAKKLDPIVCEYLGVK